MEAFLQQILTQFATQKAGMGGIPKGVLKTAREGIAAYEKSPCTCCDVAILTPEPFALMGIVEAAGFKTMGDFAQRLIQKPMPIDLAFDDQIRQVILGIVRENVAKTGKEYPKTFDALNKCMPSQKETILFFARICHYISYHLTLDYDPTLEKKT